MPVLNFSFACFIPGAGAATATVSLLNFSFLFFESYTVCYLQVFSVTEKRGWLGFFPQFLLGIEPGSRNFSMWAIKSGTSTYTETHPLTCKISREMTAVQPVYVMVLSQSGSVFLCCYSPPFHQRLSAFSSCYVKSGLSGRRTDTLNIKMFNPALCSYTAIDALCVCPFYLFSIDIQE